MKHVYTIKENLFISDLSSEIYRRSFKNMNKKKFTKEDYAAKMERLLKETNYQLQDREELIQCKDPYPAYWFVSNKGYLLSVAGKTIKHVKANYRTTGKSNKDGAKNGQNWYYEYRTPGKKWNTKVTAHTLFAEYFLGYERNKDLEVHHIKKSKSFSRDESEKCNCIDNLQVLPKQIHQKATKIGSHTQDQIEKERNKNAIDIIVSEDAFMRLFAGAFVENVKQGNTTMFISNNPDNLMDKTVDIKRVAKIEPLEE